MALDWNKNVNLSAITSRFKKGGKASADKVDYPTKRTMNLYQTAEKSTNVRTFVIVGVVVLVLGGLLVKFGVLDPLAAVAQKQEELATQQNLAMELSTSLNGYDDVKEAYDGYIARYGGDSTDAISVLDMIEKRVMPRASVSGIVIDGKTVTLTLEGATLETAGSIAKDLENQAVVERVNLATATNQKKEGEATSTTLVVSLIGSEDEEK